MPSPPDAARGPGPPRHGDSTRNYRLGVLNGAVYQAGEAFMDAGTVVPLFLSHLTRSNALIGLGSALSEMGWTLPQFLVVPAVSRHRRLLWLYRRMAWVRGGALVALTTAVLLLPGAPAALRLALFFLCYGTYCFAAGPASLPFMEVVSKVVPDRRLASFFSQRLFWGGILTAGVGLLVGQWLQWASGPMRWAVLFGAATLLVSVAYGLFLRIEEPEGEPGVSAANPLALLAEGFGWLGTHPSFRRLLVARVTLSLWLTASPFILLFAIRDLNAGARAAGTFLFVRVAGFVLGNLLWQRVARRHGTVGLLRGTTVAAGVLAWVAAAIAFASPWRLGWIPAGPATLALEGVMFLGGACHSGLAVAFASLMIQLSPPGRRRTFVSLMSAFVGVANLLPAVGGALVDVLDAPLVFALCGLAALFGIRAAQRLTRADAGEPAAASEGPEPASAIAKEA